MNKWYESNGANSDVVISSRIRLAEEFLKLSVCIQDKR